MENILKNIVKYQKDKVNVGVYSACSANELVIRSVIRNAKKNDCVAVIESTANQCNQFGGYTGMTPQDFKDFVENIAKEEDFALDRLILGGDHLGPLIWTDLEEEEAMKLASDLINLYVKAGYTKIHLDTSMKLKGDPEILTDEIIARRSAELAVVAKTTFAQLKAENPEAIHPVFIVGSEVPIPGGAQEVESITVTSPTDLANTVTEFKAQYEKHDVLDIWDDVIAVVVQPGVEFGDVTIDEYDRSKAVDLVKELDNYDLVFEGHSTDYQTEQNLSEMVEDGIKILKVGPGLTFALREGLFSIAMIEDTLCKYSDIEASNFIEVIEEEMLKDDGNWKKYYAGTKTDEFIKRKFSFSDRIRYYLPNANVVAAMDKMFANLDNKEIPLSVLSQYMPAQYEKVRQGEINNNAKELVISRIDQTLEVYINATNQEKLGAL